jgi:hypothetical protein
MRQHVCVPAGRLTGPPRRPLPRRSAENINKDLKLAVACKADADKYCNSTNLFPEPGAVLTCLRCAHACALARRDAHACALRAARARRRSAARCPQRTQTHQG